MLIDFQDAVVVVTGGARGIGRVVAETFALEHATVIVCDLPGPDLDAFERANPPIGVEVCDVSNLRVLRRFENVWANE